MGGFCGAHRSWQFWSETDHVFGSCASTSLVSGCLEVVLPVAIALYLAWSQRRTRVTHTVLQQVQDELQNSTPGRWFARVTYLWTVLACLPIIMLVIHASLSDTNLEAGGSVPAAYAHDHDQSVLPAVRIAPYQLWAAIAAIGARLLLAGVLVKCGRTTWPLLRWANTVSGLMAVFLCVCNSVLLWSVVRLHSFVSDSMYHGEHGMVGFQRILLGEIVVRSITLVFALLLLVIAIGIRKSEQHFAASYRPLQRSVGDSGAIGVHSSPHVSNHRRRHKKHARSNTSSQRSWWSQLTFSFISSLVALGVKRPLGIDDTAPLAGADRTAHIAQLFQRYWHEECLKHPSTVDQSRRSLIHVFNRLFGSVYYWLGALKFCSDMMAFAGPVLLERLVDFVEYRDTEAAHGSSHSGGALWEGYMYAGGLIASTILSAIMSSQYSFYINIISMRLRAAVISAVYRKSLTVTPSSRREFTTGQITNIMSVDTDQIVNIIQSFHQFWSLPVQIGVALFLLYRQVQLGLLGGLAVIITLLPTNAIITKYIGKFTEQMLKYKDERVGLCDEMLHHIRSIKYFAWEFEYLGKVQRVRNLEMAKLKARKYLDALCVYFWVTTPVLTSLATFAMYTKLGHELTAAKVFTALALFNTLITPINAFPWVINGLVQGRVSVLRFKKFMNAPDLAAVVNKLQHNSIGADCDDNVSFQPHFGASSHDSTAGAVDSRVACGYVSLHSVSFTYQTVLDGMNADTEQDLSQSYAPQSEEEDDYRRLLEEEKYDQDDEPSNSTTTQEACLHNVTVHVRPGELVGIVGTVGTGKSSLLLGLAGELEVRSGSLQVGGSIAYVPQEAWIESGTIRSNIVFGRPYNTDVYHSVLHACCLLPDLAQIKGGDLAEIGTRGVNLSGGQRARICLARAVYRDADVYLLDDPLSAVDTHVGAHIMKYCIFGLLGNKTCLLVTHHIRWLQAADRLLYVTEHGHIETDHTYKEVVDLMKVHDSAGEMKETPTAMDNQEPEEVEEEDLDQAEDQDQEDQQQAQQLSESENTVDAKHQQSDGDNDHDNSKDAIDHMRKNGLTESEHREVGTLDGQVFRTWTRSMGTTVAVLILVSLALMQASKNYGDYWLSHWTSQTSSSNGSVDTHYLLKVLAYVALANSVFTLFRAFIFAYGGIRAAVRIFDELMGNVLLAPISFYDSNPSGRILNRFSTDMYAVDEQVPFMSNILLAQLFILLGSLVIISFSIPLFMSSLLPLGAAYHWLQKHYRYSSREIRRLDSVSRSPIFSSFGETLDGIVILRTFDSEHRMRMRNLELLDNNQRVQFANVACGQWLNIRLQCIGVCVVAFVSLFAVISSQSDAHSISASLIGLSLAYALPITGTLNSMIWSVTATEKEFVSLERLIEYMDIVPEEPEMHTALKDIQTGEQHPHVLSKAHLKHQLMVSGSELQDWPSQGTIEFMDYSMWYRDGLPPALDHVDFKIQGGTRCGVVGRTGSGKSSCIQALLRTRSQTSGCIRIDGIDTSSLSLFHLRSGIAVIPQEPTLFSGSVRHNMDPFDQFRDQDIWYSLEQCGMDTVIKNKHQELLCQNDSCTVQYSQDALELMVSGSDAQFSIGERQLLCLARALLRSAKIVCLDEATAQIDSKTDAHIQHVIRTSFKHSTMFIIAHRIETIIHCDQVIVLDQGKIVECGDPKQLQTQVDSTFYSMMSMS
jgi:ATP-binding cassette, subfamily C (CFTR/MRP), member 10